MGSLNGRSCSGLLSPAKRCTDRELSDCQIGFMKRNDLRGSWSVRWVMSKSTLAKEQNLSCGLLLIRFVPQSNPDMVDCRLTCFEWARFICQETPSDVHLHEGKKSHSRFVCCCTKPSRAIAEGYRHPRSSHLKEHTLHGCLSKCHPYSLRQSSSDPLSQSGIWRRPLWWTEHPVPSPQLADVYD